jgi:DUF971 family protein
MVAALDIHLDQQTQIVRVSFDDSTHAELTAEYLRVESPSAEVQGHGPSQRRLQHGKRQVRIVTLEPVGNYAVRILFDDGHDTGIYSWAYLRRLGQEQPYRWRAYLDALEVAGLERG